MVVQLVVVTKEEFPSLILATQKKALTYISVFMVAICAYLTLVQGIVYGEFTPAFTAIGILLLAALLSPMIYFYFSYIEEPEYFDPFTLDLKDSRLIHPVSIEDKYIAAYEKELEECDDKNSPPY